MFIFDIIVVPLLRFPLQKNESQNKSEFNSRAHTLSYSYRVSTITDSHIESELFISQIMTKANVRVVVQKGVL